MYITYLFILLFLQPSRHLSEISNDFDYQLSQIVSDFKDEIMNEDKCVDIRIKASRIGDEIEVALKSKNGISIEEINDLRQLKKEADALEQFIGSCCRASYVPSIADLNLANRRIGASISYKVKDKYCVDVICVTIGKYVVFFAENNSSNDYNITYKMKYNSGEFKGFSAGSGSMGLPKKSIRNMHDNRGENSQRSISVLGIACKETSFGN